MQDLSFYRPFLVQELTQSSHEHGKYICPICNSGRGSHRTAAFSLDKDQIHGKCFSCGFYGDIYDLIMQLHHISQREAAIYVMNKYGTQKTHNPIKEKPGASCVAAVPSEIKAHIEACCTAMPGSKGEAYLHHRGFTQETIQQFHMGYDPRTERITIPYDDTYTYYDTRAINPDAYMPHGNLRGVKVPLFHASALLLEQPCFVVESPLCAISIEQEGGHAVSISGTSGQNRLLNHIKDQKPNGTLILCLDNDDAGQKAQSKLVAELEKLAIPVMTANIADECKDPNELLMKDPARLRSRIKAAIREATEFVAKDQDQQFAAYYAESAVSLLQDFYHGTSEKVSTEPLATGFVQLDTLLDGGFYPGLYTIGAVSSLGKTTFVLQLMDHFAALGQDVLFFSLETAASELVAKSLSRLSYSLAKRTKLQALTTRDILNRKRQADWGQVERQLLQQAVGQYAGDIGEHIWIEECIGKLSVQDIQTRVERHISITGHHPVVCIDYLQLLKPVDYRASDKQIMDHNMVMLKQLSRDKKITILCVSSLNRDSYYDPIGMTAFKESGSIEYGSDVLIGLQYSGMEYVEAENERAHEKRVRQLLAKIDQDAQQGRGIGVDVKILKNRNSARGFSQGMLLYPKYNLFIEKEVKMNSLR